MAVKKPTKGFVQQKQPVGQRPGTKAQEAAANAKRLAAQRAQEQANNTYAKEKAAYDGGSLTAHLTDPEYQRDRADLDLQLNNARNDYESAMGTGGAKGSIWNDYDYAVNALTRGNRKDIGQTNAGLSGSNLAGSGIARKQLSDIAAEFFSDKSKMDTDRTRLENDATRAWQDQQTRFNAGDLAGMQGAAFRWGQLNDAPEAPKKLAKAPAGKQFVKKADGIGWTAQPIKKPAAKPAAKPKPGFKPVQGVGTVKPGTAAPVPAKTTAPPGTKFVKQPNGKFKAVKV